MRSCLGALLLVVWSAGALGVSVFSTAPQAHALLRSRRANSMFEELRPPSKERECIEEVCDFEEAREIFQTRETTLEFWTVYKDGNQCIPNPCVNGNCVDKFQSYECLCFHGYEGKHCNQLRTATNCSVRNGDCDHDCQDRADGRARACSCLPGYQLQENGRSCGPSEEYVCGRILIHKSIFNIKPVQGLQPWLMGGEKGLKGESPWQVLVLNANGRFHCGGVLIDKNWVLTAAHCLENSRRFSVRLGDYERLTRENSEVVLLVSKAIAHPDYDPVTVDNDIALLRLSSPAPFTQYILPACLPSPNLAEGVLHLNGTSTIVTGWGKDNETAVRYSSALHYIWIPLVDRATCASLMTNNVSSNVLCAGVVGRQVDACEGDSGGPMMVKYRDTWFLIGLVSWGEGCGQKNKVGIYTKVSNYRDWIDQVRQEWS
ncbi:vitamin K-dependent protein C [Denticeps clupeoides]|uniref:vitamin K-dependent protein C-like n=1 Tax=Denticeps clupeoides TaxID=299321 RepID=UPI0010A3C5B7|nr:vitamin K-dependent protein C-like [Denticeps clupeoides]XP_028831175.1 vitamin K-dependent protein C-like [Denticeps clupeoides]XP_028831176.1 vitamin K-dependent protein C-like [Denticeps clupeoides]XP_028831177.1 vitamin K-dependent protein C-like [Denticeps clupeoides]XP_028831178.1 vitamin K-dependent protein C-like [Denticeps clupeoides]XP_028831179.1 vitamin K-dependent protein C-like [Denticeps clupeoides]XP_028831181.1 vitamin K-dependent protein C-like [Denticeps clupeoides]XP_0